uniref:Uncharacterized protein n=1 Tax=Heliothis virescens TaxID=7102 RepID=A0A2A4K611_HELVI
MDLPDCPPGAEGYQDSVTEVPKKPELEEPPCTKAELEFQEHLNSLKIKLEDGVTRCMVERRGRDISGKWIYLCYPCAAVCSGESILQTHISGKKHKTKLTMRTVWPMSIFDDHPFNQHGNKTSTPTEKVLQKMAQEVDLYNKNPSDLDLKYNKYRNVTCHIQDSLDTVKAPLLGVEYLIEHPPEQAHYEPSYMCTLCSKQGHPRTIINHMTCFWHRYNYLLRHFATACSMLTPYRAQHKYREGVGVIMNRLAQRIEDKYGRKRPVNIDKEEYERDKEQIHQWIFRGHHYSEKDGPSFVEVVDVGLIDSLHKSNEETKSIKDKRDPSPPSVAAPSRPLFNNFSRPAGRQERRAGSVESLSDISDELDTDRRDLARQDKRAARERLDSHKSRYEPYPDKRRAASPARNRGPPRPNTASNTASQEKQRPPNYEYKVKLASEKRQTAEESAKKTLAYHEKNPEKHPLYPEEWKKFWNRRYKEIQAEGKDPSKHDFKPEWIVFWTARMKELHEEELRIEVNEIYRRMCLSPPDMNKRASEPRQVEKPRAPELRRKTPERLRRDPEPRRSAERRRSSERRRSAERRRSVERRRSPDHRRMERPDRPDRFDHRGREPLPRRRTPPEFRRVRRTPPPHYRRSPGRRRSMERRSLERRSLERRRSPPPHKRTRSRSPMHRRSPVRTHIALEGPARGSRSPLSQREAQRNRSPDARHAPRQPPPSLQTVLISDDELKPDDGLSPWNSDNDIDSIVSEVEKRDRSRAGSAVSRTSRPRKRTASTLAPPVDDVAADDVVATLRLLVALEDYLGSLGPKVVDLLTDALKMEKEKANSSEELLERESAVVLIETAKEKLKGAVQAGLVGGGAAAALRAAVVRAAATLHEADKRARAKRQTTTATTKPAVVPVAGVGEVDRAQIAQQMAEALIAQGKTDVSSEDLAQLVDAVVGMAEAKKREAEKAKRVVVAPPPVEKPARPTLSKMSGTASALQMLQSAYNENDKKMEKDDVPDVMDGLSDSDLETLLKNFNELSAEEQHSLIAYLKKLEAKEPQRVERLRQYVSEAASTAAKEPEAETDKQEPAPASTVVVESDDDDYTVEEVFQSATQKVKEDQIRQEMEIVKKSLEESKPEAPVIEPTTLESSLADISKNLSSASDLFALVQASLKSTPAATPAPLSRSPNVVVSNTQPRSFGDLPEPTVTQEPVQTPTQSAPVTPASLLNQFVSQGSGQAPFQNQPAGLLRPPVRHPAPNQQQMPQHQQNRPQQQQQQQNYSSQQNQHYNQQQNYQPQQSNYQQNNQHNQPPPQHQHHNQQGQHQNNQPMHNQQYQAPQHQQQYQPPQHQQNFNDNRNKNDHFNQGQWNPRGNMMDNRGPPLRGPAPDNFGPNTTYNQGPRNNFMNGRGQDNYDTRPQNMNQQYNNYDNNQNNNFRGRGGGRGHFGGPRGRGRGYY